MIPRDFDASAAVTAQTTQSQQPSQQPQQYRVQRTDTSVDDIAKHFAVTTDAIVHANPGKFDQSLKVMPGDVLTIPASDPSSSSPRDATAPATTPQQQVDKALADLHAAEQTSPHNRMEAQALADSRAQLQDKLNQAVDAEVQARLSEKPPVDTSLTPQQRKELGETAPSEADRAAGIRQDIVDHYKGDADVQQAVDTQEANTILRNVDQATWYTNPKEKLQALDAELQSASSDQVRSIAGRQSTYLGIVKAASDWAAQPFNGNTQFQNDGQFAKAAQGADDASARYVDMLSGISSQQMRADLIANATPQLDQLAHFASYYLGADQNQHVSNAMTNLSSVVGILGQQDRAAAQSLAGDLVDHMTIGRAWTGGDSKIELLTDAVKQSSDPTLALSIIDHVRGNGKDPIANNWADNARGQVFQAVADSRNKVGADLQGYVSLTGELGSLIAKEGQSMTADQLNQAIDAYSKHKGAQWEQNVAQSQQQLAADGKSLLSQEAALGAWFANHPDDADAAGNNIKSLVNDQSAQAAIKLAVQFDPTLMQGEQGQNMITFMAQAGKVADQGGRKMIQELGTNYVKGRMSQISSELAANNDIATRSKALDELTELGNNKSLAAMLGLSDAKVVDLKSATDLLKKNINDYSALSDAAKSPDTLKAALQSNLDDTKNALSGIKGFASGTPISNVFRAFSVAAAGFSMVNAYDKAGTPNQNPNGWVQARNDLSAFASTVGFSQKTVGLATSMGLVGRDSLIGKLGARGVDHFANYLSGGIDVWKAGEDFNKGDNTEGGLYAMTGVGSIMWAAGNAAAGGEGMFAGALAGGAEAGSWAGPIGIGLVALGTMGLMAYQDKKANDQAVPGRDAFLQGLGYNKSAANALAAWHSNDDAAPTSMLMRYGELHGLNPQQTMTWFNGLNADQQKTFAGAMLSALDTVGGDASKFQATSKNDHNWDDMAQHNELLTGNVDHGIFGSGPGVLLDGSFMASTGFPVNTEEQPDSAHQLDITLQDLLGANPA
ncbi:LysM peptidoglycan-binding domain-containing protein [Dyella choica]|uniref:LysM domain-containing protein n=1 Tax=Dyella choica TaxID=1927959 RepID=A0A3S0Q6S2_9GAMM|nr:LysM peptidoglycan-binding domain-containing protein [Dyella choica]RUL79049.1 hypothetical protein EKH80_04425 [Dyella choica]